MKNTARRSAIRLALDLARLGIGAPNRDTFARAALSVADTADAESELCAAMLDLSWLLSHDDAPGCAQGLAAVWRALYPRRVARRVGVGVLLVPAADDGAARAALDASVGLAPPFVALRKLHAYMAPRDIAYALCRGSYQRNLIAGVESLSGSSLKGKARSYAGRYAASRTALLDRCRAAGVPVGERRGAHGRRILTIAGADAGEGIVFTARSSL